jgi:hypothetical protein
LRVIWKDFLSLWEGREEVVHGKDGPIRIETQKRRLLKKLQRLHRDREHFLPTHIPFLIAPTIANDPQIGTFVITNFFFTIETYCDMWVPKFR